MMVVADCPATVQEWAQLYISKRWPVVPLAPKSKACVDEGWLRLVFKPDDFRDGDNIGIRNGNGLIDIDCDAPEVVACVEAFITLLGLHTGAVYGRPNKPNAHWLFWCDGFDKLVVYKDLSVKTADKATLIEIRVNHQSMCPPSVHPDGQVLAWREPLTDAGRADHDTILRLAQLTATCALISRHYNPPGNRHDWGLGLAGTLRNFGLTEVEATTIFEWAARWAHDAEVADRLTEVRSTFQRTEDDPLKAAKALIEAMGDKGKPFVDSLRKVWGTSGRNAHGFITDDNGKILASNQENIRRGLEKLECHLSFDVFAQKQRIRWGDFNGTFDDRALNRLWFTFEATLKFRPVADYFQRALEDIACANSFHPVRDYLNGLTWDGTPRVDEWLVKAARAANSPYTRAVSALVLIAAVRRVRTPGCKFDEMLILESQQGWAKSTAMRALCPDESWFSDDLPLNVDSKQLIERTLGKWFIEASDLSGMSKSRVEHLKSLLSRPVDGPVRMAYGHVPNERPRHFIIVGTTNKHTYLNDSTGNRRFWPVRVDRFDIQWVMANRDQLWAEAAVREQRGESIRLAPSLWADAARQQENRQHGDVWADRLAQLFDPDKDYRVTNDALREMLGLSLAECGEREMTHIAAVMQSLGFRRAKVRPKKDELNPRPQPVTGWARDAEQGPLFPGQETQDAEPE